MWFLYLIGIILVYSFFQWVINIRRKKIREQVAQELFSNSGIETTIENSRKKLSHVPITKQREVPRRIASWELSRLPKYATKIARSVCPKCDIGYLKVVYTYNGYGRVPTWFSCSRNECGYKVTMKQAKAEYQQENVNSFEKDFKQVNP